MALLDAVGVLGGWSEDMRGRLSDRLQPDVMRRDPRCQGIFIGEAKAAEPPSSVRALAALFGYLRVLKSHPRSSMLVLAVPEGPDAARWASSLSELARAAGCELLREVSVHDSRLIVVRRGR